MTKVNRAAMKLLLGTGVAIALGAAAQGQSLRITNFNRGPGGIDIGWDSSVLGSAYALQWQQAPQDLIWRLPSAATPYPISSNRWTTAAGTNSSGFYRVVAVPTADRGKVIATTMAGTMPTLVLNVIFQMAGIPITPTYSVAEYKVVYETISPLGARTTGSGALLLPVFVRKPLPLVSYQHGTITQTNKAPSAMDPNTEFTIGLALATSGYAVAMPDYLGLGDSPGPHPFHHARSEATASVDMLRAAKALSPMLGYPLTNRLFLAGYSQGGHATMALLREIETFHTNEFTVTACAPMAGAYDLSGVTATDFLSSRQFPNPYYFLFLLAAYQDVYHLAPSLGDLLVPPYNTNLPPLLNGSLSGADLNAQLPADPTQILKPDYLTALRANPRHPLRLALQENDLYNWKPVTPLRLYHCAGDQDVIFANSQVALASFQSLGATNVQLIDPVPAAGHTDCAQPSLLLAKDWFDSLK